MTIEGGYNNPMVPKVTKNPKLGALLAEVGSVKQGAETPAKVTEGQGAETPAKVLEVEGAETPAKVLEVEGAETPAEVPEGQGAETPAEVPEGQGAETPAEVPEGQGTGTPAEVPEGQGTGTPAEVPEEKYTVLKGDTLWRIVQSKYGLSDKTEIANVINKIVEFNTQNGNKVHLKQDIVPPKGDKILGDRIFAGETIVLPGKVTFRGKDFIRK